MAETITDILISEMKSLQVGSGGIPFPSSGIGWGASRIWQSEEEWSNYMSSPYGLSPQNNVLRYKQLVGDLSLNSLVMAEYRFLSNSIPEAPLQVKEKEGGTSGKKGESKVIDDHPLLKLWNRPNDSYTGVDLLKGIAFSIVLSGNGYIIKFKNKAGTEPLELWWEPHWTIRPMVAQNGSSFVDHYELNRNGQWYPIDVEQVIHIRDGIHPYNQRIGLTGNDAVLPELFGDGEAANYYATLMGGAGTPSFAVTIDADKKMTQETITKLSAHLLERTTGTKKGQPFVLHGGRPIKIGFNPREMDLRETRYTAEDRFCAVKGVPAVVLELGSGMAHSIYHNVKEAQERAWRGYVMGKLTMIENALNLHLLEDFEGANSNRYCEHDLSQIQALQEDLDSKARRLGELYQKGGITRQELRSGMGYGTSLEANEDIDKVFFSPRGGTLVKPDEQPVMTGEQIVNMVTGEIRVGAPPAQAPSDAASGAVTPATDAAAAEKQSLRLVKSLAKSLKSGALVYAHDLSSVQLNMPADISAIVKAIEKGIAEEDLTEKGREDAPHITLLFGLHTQDWEDVADVIQKEPYVKLKFGEVSLFAANGGKEYDVVKIDIVSNDLRRMNKKLRDSLDVTSDFPNYQPHMTLAYVRAGTGEKYAGMPNTLSGKEITLSRVMFSNKDGNIVEIPLGVVKSMPNKKSGVTTSDINATISFLKKQRMKKVVDLIHAKKLPVPESKKSNGDSVVL